MLRHTERKQKMGKRGESKALSDTILTPTVGHVFIEDRMLCWPMTSPRKAAHAPIDMPPAFNPSTVPTIGSNNENGTESNAVKIFGGASVDVQDHSGAGGGSGGDPGVEDGIKIEKKYNDLLPNGTVVGCFQSLCESCLLLSPPPFSHFSCPSFLVETTRHARLLQ